MGFFSPTNPRGLLRLTNLVQFRVLNREPTVAFAKQTLSLIAGQLQAQFSMLN